MGENARQRAREIYDWKVVIAAYEQLWRELAEIRVRAPEYAPVKAGKPPIRWATIRFGYCRIMRLEV